MEPVTVIAGNRPTDHDFPSMNGIPGHDRFNVPRGRDSRFTLLSLIPLHSWPPR
jgi:hypothetical protein